MPPSKFAGHPAWLLMTASALALHAPAHAGEAMLPDAPPATQEERAPIENSADSDGSGDIVVTAERLSGQLDTDVPAEIELDEAAIASYGATSVADLLAALSPQTRSGRGRGGGQPIVLVNGRRVSGFQEIRNIPPDAIAKVEVFPEEVALQYGYSADERVVNFVLKPNFRQLAVDPEYGLYTQGGRSRFELDNNFLRISENARINVNAAYETESLLTEDERDLVPVSGNAADTVARSLLPSYDKYIADVSVARSLDKVTQLTLTGRFEQTDSLSLLGPGVGGIADPLERDSRNRIASTGASANGMIGKWRWVVSGNYRDTDQRIFTDRLTGTHDRFDSSQQVFGANTTLSGTLAEGWAGPIRTTFAADYDGQRFDSRSERALTVATTDLARDAFGANSFVSIPLLDPDYGVANIGTVALNASFGLRDVSDFGGLNSWGAGINWSVSRRLSFNFGYNSDQAAPGIQQLGAAPLVTPQVAYFDFATGQTVFIETISGGNPLLNAEQRRDLRFGINWQVIDDLGLSVQLNRNRSDDTTNAFPILTPEIEAAFPDRVTRDGAGQLVRLDLRPVNYDRTETAQLRWGINFGRSFGQPQRGPGGAGGPPGAGPRGPGGPPPGAGAAGARPAGAGRGGGGGGGFGRMMMGGPGGGGRWQFSLYHTVKFDDTILIRPGVPELDLLDGSAVGEGGGSARHALELDGGIFNNGVGMRFSGRYDSGSRIDGGLTGSDLAFGDLATFNLRAFINFESRPAIMKAAPWLKGFRLAFVVDNIFDAQRRITDAGGTVPLRYQPGYIDPQGRYVEISLRKAF
jgi:iron complex outermembrane recepter protein